MERIPYKKARMLKYWSGRLTSHTTSFYEIEIYGHGLKESVNEFLDKGLLRISLPHENVDKATIPELKQFLKSAGEKHTGNKSELCQRIVFNFSDEQLASFFNKSFYVLTDSGNQQLFLNSVFFLNDRFCCGLTESEINNATKLTPDLPDYKILIGILNKKLPIDIKQNEFNIYNSHLRSLFRICIDYEEYEEAILYLWLYLYNELSGLQKPWYGESLPRVNDIQYVRIDTEPIRLLDECINSLSWDMDNFKEFILQHCADVTPDFIFHYYDIRSALLIICDQLMGTNYSPITCKLSHNNPNPDSKEYAYYSRYSNDDRIEISIEEEPKEMPKKVIEEAKEESIDEEAFVTECVASTARCLMIFLNNNGIVPDIDKVEIYSNCFELKLKFKSENDIQFISEQGSAIADLLESRMIWTKNHGRTVASIYIVHPDSYFNNFKKTKYFKLFKWYSLSVQN